MKYAGLAILPALLLLLGHVSHAGVVKGATASAEVDLANGNVTVTVANVSQQDITAFVVNVTCIGPDGGNNTASHSKEYGLPALTYKLALHPGETTEVQMHCGHTIPETRLVGVDAEVTVAIYGDQTAEVQDELSFQWIIDERAGLADAIQICASAVKKAVSNSPPTDLPAHEHARLILERLLKKSQAESLKGDQKFFNRSFQLQLELQGEIDSVRTAPAGREREFIQQEANRLQRRATLAQKYADVRRLP
jgi:hypothetical protein